MPFIELVAQRARPTPPAGMQPPENAKDWFRMEATPDDADSTDIYVYESIGGWFGMWADDFIRDLKQVTTSKINLRLNSPGGSVFDGIAIANALRAHPANVTVYVDSLAASIASVIALAGNRIVMMPQSQFMVHNASGACYGDASEMTRMADLLDKQSRNIAEAYAQHTGGSLAEWQDYMAAETWFTAEEAVAVGLADEVVPMRPREEEPAEDAVAARMHRVWDLSMYQYAGREQAPAPKTAGVTVPVMLAGQVVDQTVLDAARRTVRNAAPAEPVMQVGSPEFREYLLNAIREELATQAAATPTPPPDEDEEEEEEEPETEDTSDETPTNQARPDPVGANSGRSDVVPIPQDGLKPGECNPPLEHPVDTGLGDPQIESTETHDEADDWTKVVGFLASPTTSPSADDVFAQLKEGW